MSNLEQPTIFVSVEWLCTQERWDLEVVNIFVAAARYRRATVGRSYNDAYPDFQKYQKAHG